MAGFVLLAENTHAVYITSLAVQQGGEMEKIVLTRHGEYNYLTGDLTEEGVLALHSQVSQFRDMFDGFAVEVHASVAYRAIQSANALVGTLGVPVTRERALLSPVEGSQLKVVMNIVRTTTADILMFVTHAPVINALQKALSDLYPDISRDSSNWPVILDHGESLVIDMMSGEVSTLPGSNMESVRA
jgi:broad specificity phosphatase PhoE